MRVCLIQVGFLLKYYCLIAVLGIPISCINHGKEFVSLYVCNTINRKSALKTESSFDKSDGMGVLASSLRSWAWKM